MFVFAPYSWVNYLLFQHNHHLNFFMCLAHGIIVWLYYHLLLRENLFFSTKTLFGIFRYFWNKRERLQQKKYETAGILCLWETLTLFSFYYLEKDFQFRGRPWTWTIFKFIEKFVFVPYLWVNYLLFLHNHHLEFFRVLNFFVS